jgi:TonB family protein
MVRYGLGLIVALVLAGAATGQEIPKLPKKMPGVVDIPHLNQQPVKMVKPVYPPEALQKWIQATIMLQVVLDTNGNVEQIGCDQYCIDARPDMIKAAADAVRQWKWNPVLVKGQPTRVRTRATVEFTLDDHSPAISVCNILRDPKTYDGHVVNVFGDVQHVQGINVLYSPDCDGTVEVAMNGDATPPVIDSKYAQLEQAVNAGGAKASLRGLIRDYGGIGQLAGKRIVLQRVLQAGPK